MEGGCEVKGCSGQGLNNRALGTRDNPIDCGRDLYMSLDTRTRASQDRQVASCYSLLAWFALEDLFHL